MNFQSISADELESLKEKNPSLYIIDVREPKELDAFGCIPGAINIPIRQIPKRLGELPSHSTEIVVVCQSGSRSYDVSAFLSSKGYEKILNLEEGTLGWVMSGKKVNRVQS